MNVNDGEILSLVSLPDYDINKRDEIIDTKFINKITKGVYELGSVFKTFTLAGALNEKEVNIDTNFENLPKSIKCAGRKISEYDLDIPSTLTAEQILIRSGNIGSVRIAQKMGIEKTINFKFLKPLEPMQFDLEEMGKPLPFKWGKCKLATVSFGHGISTTPLQVATAYAIISNGGYKIKPTLIKQEIKFKKKNKILNNDVSKNINSILRKIVSTKRGNS